MKVFYECPELQKYLDEHGIKIEDMSFGVIHITAENPIPVSYIAKVIAMLNGMNPDLTISAFSYIPNPVVGVDGATVVFEENNID